MHCYVVLHGSGSGDCCHACAYVLIVIVVLTVWLCS